jgi:hypothetical protein
MPVIVIDWRYVHQSTISRGSVRAKPTPTSDTCTGHEAEPNFTNYKYYCSSRVIQRAAFEKAKDLEGAQFLTWCCSSWSSGWRLSADQPQGECCVRSNVAPIVGLPRRRRTGNESNICMPPTDYASLWFHCCGRLRECRHGARCRFWNCDSNESWFVRAARGRF